MSTKTMLSLTILALATAAGMAFAQTPAAPKQDKYYKLEFVFQELEGGKVLNARSYSTVAGLGKDTSTIRAGSRVPVWSGSEKSQFTYLDIGVNIDCRSITEVPGDQSLSLTVSADISSVPFDNGATGTISSPAPTVRQNRWASSVIVPLKKPTLLFSSDDPMSKRQVQLQLTATPIP